MEEPGDPSDAAAGVDQPPISVVAAGATMDLDLPQMGSDDTAATSSRGAGGRRGIRVFNDQVLKGFLARRDWENVEKQLHKVLSSVSPDQNPIMLHPSLFIPVYQEWIVGHLQKQEVGAALKIFIDKVVVLQKSSGSEFVNQNELKTEVSRLHEIAEVPMKATPAEKIESTLDDYFCLYFTPLPRDVKQPDRISHLWQFAKMVGKPIRQKDPNFRCLACGAAFNNITISKMRDHLDIGARGRTCPKLTKNMLDRFNEGEKKRTGKRKMGPEHHDQSSAVPSRHAKVGRFTEQNIATKEESTHNFLTASLVDAIHANCQSLEIVSAGKPLEQEVEKRLKSATDILGKILSQKSKHD